VNIHVEITIGQRPIHFEPWKITLYIQYKRPTNEEIANIRETLRFAMLLTMTKFSIILVQSYDR